MTRAISNCIGIDDAPFVRGHRGDVAIVGAVFTRQRLDGIVTGRVRKDGANSTSRIAAMIEASQFDGHVRGVLLQGITLAGFNVVDIHGLARRLGRPVLVVARRRPDLPRIRRALLRHVPGGERKWRLIERAGEMERCNGVFVQRAGISLPQTASLLGRLRVAGALPEPLRIAHLVAGGLVTGHSSGRA